MRHSLRAWHSNIKTAAVQGFTLSTAAVFVCSQLTQVWGESLFLVVLKTSVEELCVVVYVLIIAV